MRLIPILKSIQPSPGTNPTLNITSKYQKQAKIVFPEARATTWPVCRQNRAMALNTQNCTEAVKRGGPRHGHFEGITGPRLFTHEIVQRQILGISGHTGRDS